MIPRNQLNTYKKENQSLAQYLLIIWYRPQKSERFTDNDNRHQLNKVERFLHFDGKHLLLQLLVYSFGKQLKRTSYVQYKFVNQFQKIF